MDFSACRCIVKQDHEIQEKSLMGICRLIFFAAVAVMLFFTGCLSGNQPQTVISGGVIDLEEHTITFSPLFSSGAVLQRDIPIPVWGKASPRARIRCTLNGTSRITVADMQGYFRLYLPPQSAASGLALVAEDLTNNVKTVSENIAVGEVYLVAGQSNMEYEAKFTPTWKNKDFQHSNDPDMRFFRIPVNKYPGPQSSLSGSWKSDSPQNSGKFSAIGYFFAREMREKFDRKVPVGIIGAYLGGMGAETFTSREALLRNPDFAAEVKVVDLDNYDEKYFQDLPLDQDLPNSNKRLMATIRNGFPADKFPAQLGLKQNWHLPEFDDNAWEEIVLPDSWTVAGYNHAGVFWFRKAVDIPEKMTGKELTLAIGEADKCDETYFNGTLVGTTGDYREFKDFMTKRTYKVPAHLVKAGRNVIAVRVSSAASIATDGGLTGPEKFMKLTAEKSEIPLAGKWKMKMEHNFGTWGMEFMRTMGPGAPTTLHTLYDNMIHPLIPFAMRGVVWYQGEANAICMADTYQRLLLTMIDDWRFRWGQEKLDFIIIQLPGYQPASDYQQHSQWAKLREAQRLAALESNSSLIVTLPYGDEYNIHPGNKAPVASLAAAAAWENLHNSKSWQPPMPQNCFRSGSTLTVVFDREITADTPVKTLFAAGKDKVFYPAAAEINGNKLIITSSKVTEPLFVRYAWSNNPHAANLYSAKGNYQVPPFEIKASN